MNNTKYLKSTIDRISIILQGSLPPSVFLYRASSTPSPILRVYYPTSATLHRLARAANRLTHPILGQPTGFITVYHDGWKWQAQ